MKTENQFRFGLFNPAIAPTFALALTSLWPSAPVLAQEAPAIQVPNGYGRYCSVTWPSGRWAFMLRPDKNSDPCAEIIKTSTDATIERAGIWNTNGNNNALVRCNDGIWVYRGNAGQPMTDAYNSVKDRSDLKKCVFTVAPTRLPIFRLPWTGVQPSHPNRFNYNMYGYLSEADGGQLWNVKDFGQTPDPAHPLATNVDRKGRQMGYLGTNAECAQNNQQPGCRINKAHSIGEGAYDFSMPKGSQLVAVASGIVRVRRNRPVSQFNCKDPVQPEVWVEHKVGSGKYAERFLTYYAHMSSIDSAIVPGKVLAAGDAIGKVGDLGCSSPNSPHLHLSVMRLTNLSGHRSLEVTFTNSGYGVSSTSGIIDPFGWAAQNIDPWAFRYLAGVKDPPVSE
jgi:hypothetical protein